MVSFVILHYMALEETIQCVESIRNNIDGDKKIVIVDNFSPNGTFKDLKVRYEKEPDVEVLETGSNLGFAKGNNFGYRFAVKEHDPDYVVVMNNDMEIRQREPGRCRIGEILRRALGALGSRTRSALGSRSSG